MKSYPYGATHFVPPRAALGAGRHPHVKTAEFFEEQGGLTEEWGRNWIPVVADGINHARLLAWFMGSGTEHPISIGFSPPNKRTLGEITDEYNKLK